MAAARARAVVAMWEVFDGLPIDIDSVVAEGEAPKVKKIEKIRALRQLWQRG